MEAASPTIRDALPLDMGDCILKLLESQTRGSEHFQDNFDLVDPKPIGCGSFGNVLLVKCVSSGVRYAIKKVVIETESSRVVHNSLLQTLQECGLSMLIGTHANMIHAHPEKSWIVLPDDFDAAEVAEVLEHGLDTPLSHLTRFIGASVYMVFNLCTEDLKVLLERHATCDVLTMNDCRAILLQIILALVCLHEKGMIHNDLKPDNVLMDHYQSEISHFQAALADFGLARSTKPSLATSISRFQRHRYDAPDQRFTVKVDLWSFATMAFHLTFVVSTGRRISNDEFRSINMHARQCDAKFLLREFFAVRLINVDSFFIEALVQCLSLTPERRPTAIVMFEVLSDSQLFCQACNIARCLHKMIGLATICLEEMIFQQWYEHELMVAVAKSKQCPQPFVDRLWQYHENNRFPLIAAFNSCSVIEQQLLVGALHKQFS